ncbi:MarR family winged helix-turn-helix transcriptional regulator [Micromonospora maritima]|uniref:MarR family winged helix-turn-helix transcriptional regulator n=1 Tax=Micromonospora maritima TaxID=986711 RepID=UPI001C2D5DA3|nr:MarR family winged helix-turn-helix transcriptional regulator [Micromonospora maritima]
MEKGALDLDLSVGYALKRAAVALRAAMDRELRAVGLSVPQYACLRLLAHGTGLSGSELARGAFVTRQSMHVLLRGLQDRGLLARAAAAPRGRALPVALTEAGRDVLTRADEIVAGVERRMTSVLSEGARHRLLADLAACVDALGGPGPDD